VDLDQVLGDEPAAPASGSQDAVDEQLIARLVGRAREGRLQLTGVGGLLAQLTKRLVESALGGEIIDQRPTWPRSTALRCRCRRSP
jgi:putative transposase